MKRILFVLLYIQLAAPGLGAQMMPDSSVQVVAYWEVGDRMEAEGTNGPVGIKQYITEEIHLGSGWPVQWVFDRYVEISQGEQFQGVHLVREIFPEDKIGGE